MRLISWLITTPLALAAILFALSNKHDVALHVFLQDVQVQTPLYLIALLPFVIGFIMGGTISWWSQRKHRRKVRQLEKDLKILEKTMEKKRHQIDVQDISEEQNSTLRLIEQK